MRFFADKKPANSQSKVTDQMARIIAGKLICLQRRLAAAISRRFSMLSGRQQRWLLLLIGLAVTVWLLTGISGNYEAFSVKSKVPYPAAHIGQASDARKPKTQQPYTDSLTIK